MIPGKRYSFFGSKVKQDHPGWVKEVNCVKGLQVGAFFPLPIVYCYLEFKLLYPKKLKLFSIRVKGLFEP